MFFVSFLSVAWVCLLVRMKIARACDGVGSFTAASLTPIFLLLVKKRIHNSLFAVKQHK